MSLRGERSGQRQDSLSDQMSDVMRVAVGMGCYDAHDWISRAWLRADLQQVARDAIAASGPRAPGKS